MFVFGDVLYTESKYFVYKKETRYIFVNLDIFKKSQHNKPISSKIEAWLTFLSSDNTEDIIRLIEECPEFKPLYHDIYEMCRNVEDIMGLFSEELQIMDRNTVQFMVDEMQDEIDIQKHEIDKQKGEIDKQNYQINKQKEEIDKKSCEIDRLKNEISQLRAQVEE